MKSDNESSEQPEPDASSKGNAMQMPTLDLSERERLVLSLYRDPANSNMSRMVIQSIGYTISGGMFTYATIAYEQPWYAIGTYVLFVAHLIVRLGKARLLAGVVPAILAKYEQALTDTSGRSTATPRTSASSSK